MTEQTPTRHLMVDLGTLSNASDAAIIQIAAIVFDPFGKAPSEAFNWYVKDSSGSTNVSTALWWMKQATAKSVGENVTGPSATTEREALAQVAEIFRRTDISQIWVHGATFDFPTLANAYRRNGWEKPWDFHSERDTRTLYSVAPGGMPAVERDPARKHDALYDCEVQVKQVVAAFAALREVAVKQFNAAIEKVRNATYDPPPVWSNAEGYTEAYANHVPRSTWGDENK